MQKDHMPNVNWVKKKNCHQSELLTSNPTHLLPSSNNRELRRRCGLPQRVSGQLPMVYSENCVIEGIVARNNKSATLASFCKEGRGLREFLG